jgi:hypothetical protein
MKPRIDPEDLRNAERANYYIAIDETRGIQQHTVGFVEGSLSIPLFDKSTLQDMTPLDLWDASNRRFLKPALGFLTISHGTWSSF